MKKFPVYILVNYSIDWARRNKKFFKGMPVINSVIRFTVGQGVPESMLIPGKLDDEYKWTYIQQGSASVNWSDRQIKFLIALASKFIEIDECAIYLMLDGTRTSTNLEGKEAYKDGAEFAKRFCKFAKDAGIKAVYVNVTETFHTERTTWRNILDALVEVIPEWKEFIEEENISLNLIGDIERVPALTKKLKEYEMI